MMFTLSTNPASNSLIEIFDLDGTLTEEFSAAVGDKTNSGLNTYSFWNLITRDLVTNKIEFDEKATAWKKMVTTAEHIDRVESSREMTEIGIRSFCENYRNALSVRKKAAEITKLLLKYNIVIPEAIEYLKHRLEQNVICIISTASYEDGALGFIDGLIECGLLPKDLASKIIVSGTQIDWIQLKVTHMNVDKNKLLGLENIFKCSIDKLKPRVQAVFGDDPAINDKALLDGVCDHSFVIKTTKNANMHLPACCIFSNWQELIQCKDALNELHQQKRKQRLSCKL